MNEESNIGKVYDIPKIYILNNNCFNVNSTRTNSRKKNKIILIQF